jgi:glutamate synthase (NADPH/NADH) large chain
VDITISSPQHTHSMPAIIGAMSFGSQGKLAYSAYAEAAYRLNTLCINGEGGELPDVMGKYPRHRGNQIASARFGVNIGFLNSCDVLEIKIGQGAKPGEGGQLPGYKVTEEVALARSTSPWVDLISPSNNHDLYSIEDLAQLIDELKTANPHARVSVKVPVVPGVGIIAVGIAKAGADIINITGYEGGTGAARAHSLRHVGLPAEIGLWLAHRALTESGLRDDVELWADGGMKCCAWARIASDSGRWRWSRSAAPSVVSVMKAPVMWVSPPISARLRKRSKRASSTSSRANMTLQCKAL